MIGKVNIMTRTGIYIKSTTMYNLIYITLMITTMPSMNVTCTRANVCGLSETLGNSKVRPGIVLKWADDFGNLNQFTNIRSLTSK